MSRLTIGVYADEYLTLLELIGDIERELPTAMLQVYGSEELLSSLPAESMDYFAESVGALLNTDLLVLLAKLPEEKAVFDKYDGTIVYAADDCVVADASVDYDDIIYVHNPLLALLDDIASVNDKLQIIFGLPLAIYGRPGVDALMQETRAVYTFDAADEEDALLPMPVAFNIHFYNNSLPSEKWEKQLTTLRKKATVSLRINPVSTVYVVDIFSEDNLELPETVDFYKPSGKDFSLEDVNNDHKIVLLSSADGRMHTLIGDYLHMVTQNLVNVIKSASGGVN